MKHVHILHQTQAQAVSTHVLCERVKTCEGDGGGCHACDFMTLCVWCQDVGSSWGWSLMWRLLDFNGWRLFLHLLLVSPPARGCFNPPSPPLQEEEEEPATRAEPCLTLHFASAHFGHWGGGPTWKIFGGPKGSVPRSWCLLVDLHSSSIDYTVTFSECCRRGCSSIICISSLYTLYAH